MEASAGMPEPCRRAGGAGRQPGRQAWQAGRRAPQMEQGEQFQVGGWQQIRMQAALPHKSCPQPEQLGWAPRLCSVRAWLCPVSCQVAVGATGSCCCCCADSSEQDGAVYRHIAALLCTVDMMPAKQCSQNGSTHDARQKRRCLCLPSVGAAAAHRRRPSSASHPPYRCSLTRTRLAAAAARAAPLATS